MHHPTPPEPAVPRPAVLAVLVCPGLLLAAPPDFDRDVAPLLAEHCLGCHAGPKPRGDLDLTRKAALTDGGRLLGERVAAGEMPPKKPLPAPAKATLKAWVEAGAKWGTDPIDPLRYTTPGRAGYDWWSLRPVRRPAVPDAGDWGRTPIDGFVLAKLTEKGLRPS